MLILYQSCFSLVTSLWIFQIQIESLFDSKFLSLYWFVCVAWLRFDCNAAALLTHIFQISTRHRLRMFVCRMSYTSVVRFLLVVFVQLWRKTRSSALIGFVAFCISTKRWRSPLSWLIWFLSWGNGSVNDFFLPPHHTQSVFWVNDDPRCLVVFSFASSETFFCTYASFRTEWLS